jgi:uncharacterized membrane protein
MNETTRHSIGWVMLGLTAVFIQVGVVLACVNNGTWVPLGFEGFILFVAGAIWLVQS